MARKYGPKASEKIGQTMHEFKRGKLKSGGSGKKVTSRKQAIAIGISQAARAGYKVPPPPRGHATIDARVRAYLSNMRPGAEIDGWGMARTLKIEPIAASHALERAQKAGLAVTEDGRWFGPRGGSVHHARKKSEAAMARDIGAAYETVDRIKRDPKLRKTMAQLDREIAEALANPRRGGRAQHSHATVQGAGRTLFAVEIDRSEFDEARGLPDGAKWRKDLTPLAEAELARGRSYRRPKDARYAVIEWSGYRAAVGRLLDWLEAAVGITRYAEIFE